MFSEIDSGACAEVFKPGSIMDPLARVRIYLFMGTCRVLIHRDLCDLLPLFLHAYGHATA